MITPISGGFFSTLDQYKKEYEEKLAAISCKKLSVEERAAEIKKASQIFNESILTCIQLHQKSVAKPGPAILDISPRVFKSQPLSSDPAPSDIQCKELVISPKVSRLVPVKLNRS